MEHILGLLRIHIHRRFNLAVRDVTSSDPYVVVHMGKQKLKTRVVKKNLNPEWNDNLTLSILDPALPIHLMVYDKDMFSLDDKMGDADINIAPNMEVLRNVDVAGLPVGTIITRIQPSRENCLAEESHIVLADDGSVTQSMILRLRNVERGEIELQLEHVLDLLDSFRPDIFETRKKIVDSLDKSLGQRLDEMNAQQKKVQDRQKEAQCLIETEGTSSMTSSINN